MHKSMAAAILQLLKQARVNVDDHQLTAARHVRAWLNGIVTGALTVSVTPKSNGEKQGEAEATAQL